MTQLSWPRAEYCNNIFNRAISDYHRTDDVDAAIKNPFEAESIDSLLYLKTWIDTVQWHLEDIIRMPDIQPETGMAIKRRIDASNQHRTDVVEQLDDFFLHLFKDVKLDAHAGLNTESPACVLDSLSILWLKI